MRKCCAAPDKAKDIIRVVIKGSSGYGPVDEAFNDKVTITRDSIRYEYTPYLASETNPVRNGHIKPQAQFSRRSLKNLRHFCLK